ncbi:MAG: lysozyme inhibitor LprI family protein [Chthoniobacteraceae bacterium]
MKKQLMWFLVIAFAVLAPVWAQTAREVNDDAAKVDAASDKKLNTAYQKLIKQIQGDDKDRAAMVTAQLREAQRAWLKYRDEQVQFVGLYNNIGSSSARNAGMSSYQSDLTNERIKDLTDVPNPF